VSPGKSPKEGQEDQGELKQLGGEAPHGLLLALPWASSQSIKLYVEARTCTIISVPRSCLNHIVCSGACLRHAGLGCETFAGKLYLCLQACSENTHATSLSANRLRSWDCAGPSPFWPVLGSILGSKTGQIFLFLGVFFWPNLFDKL
jgi:hypothetical protein